MAGAATLQQGVWVLPRSDEHENFLRNVLHEARQQGGAGTLLAADSLDGEMDIEIIGRFHADRDREYQEFIGRCRDFLLEIAKETKAENLTFAELEENEQDLHKLRDWLRKIGSRDFFDAPQAGPAAEMLAECGGALNEFANAIYAREGLQDAGDQDSTRASEREGDN